MKMRSLKLSILLVIICQVFYLNTVFSHEGHGLPEDHAVPRDVPTVYYDSLTSDIRNVYNEPASDLLRVPIQDMENEVIDVFGGLLQLPHVDINVPANGGLSLQAQRHYLSIQPTQFDRNTSVQRTSINGLGWQMHYGKLVAPTFSNASICEDPIDDPVEELRDVVENMIELYTDIETSETALASRLNGDAQIYIQDLRNILSQRIKFSDQQNDELIEVAASLHHELIFLVDDIVFTREGLILGDEEFDISDIAQISPTNLNDVNSLTLLGFFINILSGMTLDYTSRAHIAFEWPDGSRNIFFRDDVTADGSLITQSLLKLRCEGETMVVLTPDGTKYFMTEFENFIGQRGESEFRTLNFDENGEPIERPEGFRFQNVTLWGEPSWSVSKIVDVFENEIDISYLESDLGIKYIKEVSSSDQNANNIIYDYEDINSDLIKLRSITSGDKTWRYGYEEAVAEPLENDQPKRFNILTSVTRPDGRVIAYGYDDFFRLNKVTTAYGLDVDYTYQNITIFGNGDLDGFNIHSALSTKTLSGPDIETVNWTFDYDLSGVNTGVDTGSILNSDSVTVTGPYATKQYLFLSGALEENASSVSSEGLITQSNLRAIDTTANDSGDSASSGEYLISDFNDVVISQQAFSPGLSGFDYLCRGEENNALICSFPSGPTVIVKRTIYVVNPSVIPSQLFPGAGIPVSFGSMRNNFDEYGFAQSQTDFLTGSNTIGDQSSRTTNLEFAPHDTERWILGLPESTVVSGGASNGSLNTTNSFSDLGLLETSTTNGLTTTNTYFPNGELETTTDPNGNTTTFGEYRNGISTSVRNAEVETETYTINATGTVSSVTDRRGNSTGYEYDGLDRLTSIDTAANATTTISYPTGVFETRSIRAGLRSAIRYDVRGRKLQSDIDGIIITEEYDLNNRRTFVSNPNSIFGQRFEYDALNRVTMITDQRGLETTYSYSPDFASQTIVDRRGFTKIRGFIYYGVQPLLTSVREQVEGNVDDRTTRTGYNFLGQTIRVQQGGVSIDGVLNREFTYDSNFFIEQTEEPEVGVTVFETDNVGNVRSSQLSSVEPTLFEYDDVYRLTKIDYPSNTNDITYTYFDNDLLRTSSTGLISNSYDYDQNNNLINESLSISGEFGRNYRLDYTYNSRDQLSTIRYPNGVLVDYSPDELGRPTQVGSFASALSYSAVGQLESLTYGNGMQLTSTYDERFMATGVQTPSVTGFSYAYDGEGNVSSIQNSVDPTHNVTFNFNSYDGINRVRSVGTNNGLGTVNHTYNPFGDVTSVSHSGGSIKQGTLSFVNGGNARTGGANTSNAETLPSIQLVYDAYGNVIERSRTLNSETNTKRFLYDDASRLLTVISSDVAEEDMRYYQYDAQKYRVVNHIPGTYDVNYSFYSLSGDLMFEESIDTCEVVANIRLGSTLIARETDESVSAIVDTDGDGLNNCIESFVAGLDATNPNDAQSDFDQDGISNIDEILGFGSFINNRDSDGDGIGDSVERRLGLNLTRADSDNDGVSDRDELIELGFDPDELNPNPFNTPSALQVIIDLILNEKVQSSQLEDVE